jgi:hypothetical protein
MLEPSDLDIMQFDINNGFSLKEVFDKRLYLSGIDKDNICEIQATAINLVPYENLIFSIIELFN